MTSPSAAAGFGLRRALPSPSLLIGLGVPAGLLVALVAIAVLAPLVAPFDPLLQNPPIRLQPPSPAHAMGTDEFGRDIFSRVVFGTRVSLLVGVGAVAVSSVVGTAIGVGAGYVGAWWDEAAMRLMDVIMAFPGMVLAIALVSAAGSGLGNVTAVIALVQLPVFARLARASVLGVVSHDYITAARVVGSTPVGLVRRHVLPNVLAPTLTMVGLMLADAILTEAGLSFLGLGVLPPTPTWGNILSEGRQYMLLGTWWFTVFPGLAIFVTVLAINVLADISRDRLDPTRRGGAAESR